MTLLLLSNMSTTGWPEGRYQLIASLLLTSLEGLNSDESHRLQQTYVVSGEIIYSSISRKKVINLPPDTPPELEDQIHPPGPL